MSAPLDTAPRSRPTTTKQRIITHMNNDHKHHISDYCQFYCGIPKSIADTAELVDISLSQLTIHVRPSSSTTKPLTIPFKPEMTSFAQARARLVQMADECLGGLGKSPWTVESWVAPSFPLGWGLAASVIFGFYSFAFARNFEEGAFIREYILFNNAPISNFLHQYHMYIFSLIIVIHAGESLWMERSRLRRHGTRRFSAAWWGWVCGTFVEGIGSFMRFDKIVEEKRRLAALPGGGKH